MDEPDAVPIRARLRYPMSVRFAPCAALAAPISAADPIAAWPLSRIWKACAACAWPSLPFIPSSSHV